MSDESAYEDEQVPPAKEEARRHRGQVSGMPGRGIGLPPEDEGKDDGHE